MSTQPSQLQDMSSTDEDAVLRLYHQLLDSWNVRSATMFAALFTEDGNVVGFDGSQMNGSQEIAKTLGQIFADHQTAAYVGKAREVQLLGAHVVVLRAVAGMVPPGKSELNPAVNTIQTIVAAKTDDTWRIVLYQNTPAQFHGRPELVEQLTEELRQLL